MDSIDRVFGRNRLQMVTGAHVEVFREAAARGESRRYTKRFLTTADGDYAAWTEREWRILARLIGHGTRCVPDVVQYDRGASGTKLVQTYDAGATVDQWATLLPVLRDGQVHAHVFEDCAHWWALAHHCLVALDEIHTLELVHLDVKGDNICIPVGPADFDAEATNGPMFPVFRKLALIDFAFSLVSGETLTTPLPIGWQRDYDYQSPRLLRALDLGRAGDLQATEALDWRCDMYSLAAMLKRYLPAAHGRHDPVSANAWTAERFDAARSLIFRIREAHDGELSSRRPHAELIERTSAQLAAPDLARSLERGWMLARETPLPAAQSLPLTPITRLAPSIRLVIPARDDEIEAIVPALAGQDRGRANEVSRERGRLPLLVAAACVAVLVGVVPMFVDIDALVQRATAVAREGGEAMSAALRALVPSEDTSQPGSTPSLSAVGSEADVPGPASERVDTQPPADTPGERPSVAEAASPAQTKVDTTHSGAEAAPQAELPRTPAEVSSMPPPSPAPVAASAAKPAASAAPSGSSAAARIESYRSRPPQRFVTARPRAGTEARGRDAKRPTQLARMDKAPRVSPAQPSRSQSAPAPRRSNGTSLLAAAQVPARASPAAALPPPAPQPSNRGTEPKANPSAVLQGSATPTSRASQEIATTGPSAATGVVLAGRPAAPPEPRVDVPAASTTTAAVTSPIAPPVEIPRPVSIPNPPPPGAGAAPIIEPSQALVAPRAYTAPPGNAWRDARPQSAPPTSPPRGIASAAPTDVRTEPSPPQDEATDADYLDQGRRMVASVVPRTAARVYAQMTRVLAVAANAHLHVQEREVNDAFLSAGIATELPFVSREDGADRAARRLHEAARHAYWSRRHVPEALELQLAAFGANPGDPEIAGTLAFLHLRIVPVQPERARQLALHAIGLRSARYPTGRPDDWTSFSIASALAGRPADATNALFASLALSRNLDRSCRSALGALANFGERLREPVESFMSRLYAQGRDDDSPYCVQRTTRSAWSRY